MKRSEMLKIIKAVIILDDGFNSGNGMAPIDDPNLPEKILNAIEKFMSPPGWCYMNSEDLSPLDVGDMFNETWSDQQLAWSDEDEDE